MDEEDLGELVAGQTLTVSGTADDKQVSVSQGKGLAILKQMGFKDMGTFSKIGEQSSSSASEEERD